MQFFSNPRRFESVDREIKKKEKKRERHKLQFFTMKHTSKLFGLSHMLSLLYLKKKQRLIFWTDHYENILIVFLAKFCKF